MQELKTPRLILRGFRETDLNDLYAYAKNPHIGPAAGWAPHKTVEDSRAVLKSFITAEEVWAIADKKTNRVIGSIGLHNDKKRETPNSVCRMLGYVLSEEYWGQGLMTEAAEEVLRYAFCEMNLRIVSVVHFPYNIRSKRVIEKLGFTYEGLIREATLGWDGAVEDDCCYSMTSEEYFSRTE